MDIEVSVSSKVLDRQFFLDKITSEIESLEKEYNDLSDMLVTLKNRVAEEIEPGCRNRTNEKWHEISLLRSKITNRRKVVLRQLDKLRADYNKYKTIDI